MKRILFACILAAATSAAFAQTTTTTTVSKTTFVSQSNQLNTLINGNQTEQAKTKWAVLEQEMGSVVNSTMQKLDAAKAASNSADVAKYTDILQHQTGAFNNAGQFFRGDMVAYKVQLQGALADFAGTL